MLVQDSLYDSRALLDELNEEGIIIPDSEVASMLANGIRYLNMGLQEIYSKTRTYETFKITRKPVENLLGGYGTYMNLEEFDGTPHNTDGVFGAKSYYFEVDNDAIVKIQELIGSTWTDLETIDTLGVNELTSYRGLITPSDVNNRIRIQFDGTTFYRFKNVALFKQPFKVEDIPEYRAWVKYELPLNFGKLDKIIAEYPERQYSVDTQYKWEGYNKLYVNYFFNGELRVIYNPIPFRVTEMDDEIPINNPTANQFLIYYVAAKMAFTENPGIANYLEQKSNELKFEAGRGQPSSEERITDVYFSNNGG